MTNDRQKNVDAERVLERLESWNPGKTGLADGKERHKTHNRQRKGWEGTEDRSIRSIRSIMQGSGTRCLLDMLA